MDVLRMLILLIVGCVVAFFLFQIGIVLYNRMNETNELREHLVDARYVSPSLQAGQFEESELDSRSGTVPAPIVREVVKGTPMPEIPGQSDEEVRKPEPIQRRVRRAPAEEPEPAESVPQRQEEAGFTEDLRHPEASFQPHPFNNRSVPVDSGVASKVSSPGLGGDQQAYESDMAQNGGEWLKGTFAFDSREPSGFSALF